MKLKPSVIKVVEMGASKLKLSGMKDAMLELSKAKVMRLKGVRIKPSGM